MSAPEPLVFQHTVEGLLRALGDRVDHTTAQRLKQHGLDVNKLQPAYPRETWVKLMEVAAEILSPGAPIDEAMFTFGRRFFDGFTDTFMGRALLAMVRVLGPRRTLERMTRNFRTGNNYSETKLTELAFGKWQLWCNQVTYAQWYRGLITAGVSAAGAKNPSVELVSHDVTGATFNISFG
jgi:uncharacterized protein (TIGR02265 family)